jgi:hypothetical protein
MLLGMGTKSRESIYGASIRASDERAREARKDADKLACIAWNNRMLGYEGPAVISFHTGDAANTISDHRNLAVTLTMMPSKGVR